VNDARGRPRVAVTGLGIVSPLGIGAERNLAALRAGRTGLATIDRFDPAGFNCRIAAQVPDADSLREHNLDLFTSFALAAAIEAMTSAGLDHGLPQPDRLGVLIGTGLGGCETLDTSYHRLYGEGIVRLAPLSIPKSMYNAAASAVSTRFGATGPSLATVSACSSGANAIGEAALWIRAGMADVVVAGAADAPITPGIVRAWEALRVLSTDNLHPSSACRPFSLDRAGLVLGEGAAVLVLESFASAVKRGTRILGEVAGYGITSDATHLTDPQVDGPARAIRSALDDASIAPADVDYVNAHGTGTKLNDRIETLALKQAFGPHAARLAISSTKSMHGHAMGASGALELVLTLLSANEGFVPPTANLRVPDPDCDLDYVPNVARERSVRVALSSSLAFGGMNTVLAVRSRAGALEEAQR
jgi:nodulation protein E